MCPLKEDMNVDSWKWRLCAMQWAFLLVEESGELQLEYMIWWDMRMTVSTVVRQNFQSLWGYEFELSYDLPRVNRKRNVKTR